MLALHYFAGLFLGFFLISLFSPAKVNLFLQVRGKRPDGYHELASLFQAISLGDLLHFSIGKSDKISCSKRDPDFPLDSTNLILKSAQCFRNKTSLDFGLEVSIEKKIPLQSGLGGGSSNAATTLWAINELLLRPASLAELIEWSKELGSDVTFFLSKGTAYCTGRGEIIHEIPPLESNTPITIVKPNFGLSTSLVFKEFTALDSSGPANSLYFNDLEKPAFRLSAQLLQIKEELLKGGFSHVVMSGSGTSFICIGRGKIPTFMPLEPFSVQFINRKIDSWYEV